MNVLKKFPIRLICGSDGCSIEHTIEVGGATWDDDEKSIRNRYDCNGHFSPHSSSEVPVNDLPLMVAVALREALLTPAQVLALQHEIDQYARSVASTELVSLLRP